MYPNVRVRRELGVRGIPGLPVDLDQLGATDGHPTDFREGRHEQHHGVAGTEDIGFGEDVTAQRGVAAQDRDPGLPCPMGRLVDLGHDPVEVRDGRLARHRPRVGQDVECPCRGSEEGVEASAARLQDDVDAADRLGAGRVVVQDHDTAAIIVEARFEGTWSAARCDQH